MRKKNSKCEILNSKQYQMDKVQITQGGNKVFISIFENLNLFSNSILGFMIFKYWQEEK